MPSVGEPNGTPPDIWPEAGPPREQPIGNDCEASASELVLPKHCLQHNAEQSEHTYKQSDPNWHEVGPPFAAFDLPIVEINCGSDELANEI